MALRIVFPVEDEPVSLSEAKLHLRIDHSEEDGLIGDLIVLAREEIERLTSLCLAEQTWKLVLDNWPGREIRLPKWPVINVEISYVDEDGFEHEVSETDYILDTYSRPARIVLAKNKNWPAVELETVNGVRVTIVAGYAVDDCVSGEELPLRYKQAMLLLIGHYYENREAVYTAPGGQAMPLPLGVKSLLADDLKWVS